MSVQSKLKVPSYTKNIPKLKKNLRPLLKIIVWICIGFLSCGGVLFGTMRPIGLCLALAAPAASVVFIALGAAAGYTFFTNLTFAAPYLCALILAVALRCAFSFRKEHTSVFVQAIIGAVTFFAVRFAFAFLEENSIFIILTAFSESLLIAGSAYLLSSFFSMKNLVFSQTEPEQASSVCFVFMLILITATPYHIFSLVPSHLIASVIILCAAWRYGINTAAILSICSAAAFAITDTSSLYIAVGIAAGGLVASFFAERQRFSCAAAFLCTSFVGAICAPQFGSALLFMQEMIFSSFLFLIIPVRWIEPAFAYAAQSHQTSYACATMLASRLQALSSALADVGQTVQDISAKMTQRSAEVPLADLVSKRCCQSCTNRFQCWVDHASDCYRAFADIDYRLTHNEWVDSQQLPAPLNTLCIQPQVLCANAYAAHIRRSELRSIASHDRMTRAALCEQYGALASSLGALAGELSKTDWPDPKKSSRLYRLFRSLGLDPTDAHVSKNVHGRITAAICTAPVSFSQQELQALAQEASCVCHCQFSLPQVTRSHALTTLTFQETPRFDADFGVYGLPAQKGSISADAARVFFCQNGYACAVLCDGMGTGKSAAVDGIMAAQLACELLKAGFEPEETARLVHVSLTMKNGLTQETATTMDILKIDLYSGQASLFKAGASPSFILRAHSATVDTYGTQSIPLGILDRVIGQNLQFTLHEGDIAVLASDGACAENTTAFASILKEHEHCDPQMLAESMVYNMKQHSKHADDITVAALQMVRIHSDENAELT